MNRFLFCNGKFIEEGSPCLPADDRGFLFGDGVFTTLKVENGIPELFDLHQLRLQEQCKALQIIPPKILLTDVQMLISKNKATTGIWRLKIIITGGRLPLLNLQPREYGSFLMLLSPITEPVIQEVRLTCFPMPIVKPTGRLKTLSYLDRLWISEYAAHQGFDDALLSSLDGHVTESSFSNIFWYTDGAFFVPDPSLELLMGITLSHLITVLKRLGYKIHFVKEKLKNISSHSKLFICNAIKGVVPVVEIDGKLFDRDPEIEKVLKQCQTLKIKTFKIN
ncbi:MAG TPA: aminotransferase class IV [Parachlamydiaceae bacterium]|nr:aminotransferase class IV [Parachlamydiaceae bacterium]